MARVIPLVRTLAWARWRALRHRARTVEGLSDTVVTALVAALLAALALLQAVLVVAIVLTTAPDRLADTLGLVLGAEGAFAILLSLLLGLSSPLLDPARLLPYPVGPRSLYHAALLLAPADPGLAATLPAVLAAAPAAVAAGGPRALPALVAVPLYAATLVVWEQALLAGARRLMRSRRLREAVVVLGLGGWLALAVLPRAGVPGERPASRPDPGAAPAARALAPHALAVRAAVPASLAGGLAGLAGLAAWAAAGAVIGRRLFVADLLAGAHGTGRRPGTRGATVPAAGPLDLLPADVAAVAGTHLRHLARSVGGRSAPLYTAAVVLFVALAARHGQRPLFGIPASEFGFYVTAVAAAWTYAGIAANAFMWSGPGLARLLAAPVPPRRIALGLQAGHWIATAGVTAGALALWCLLCGPPRPAAAAAAVLIAASQAAAFGAAGPVLSTLFPARRDPGSTRAHPAPTPALLLNLSGWLSLALCLPGLALAARRRTVAGLAALAGALALAVLAARASRSVAARLLATRREALLAAMLAPPR